MKVDGAARVLNRKRANNIKFVSFFPNLVVIFGSFYTQISYFVANRLPFRLRRLLSDRRSQPLLCSVLSISYERVSQ